MRRLSPVKRFARLTFHTHLWLGVIGTAFLVLVCVTGILLNHKKALGYMPDVEHRATSPFDAALPLAELARRAAAAAPGAADAGVDRMDVRPDDGLVKVRFDDPAVTEVTVDLGSGAVLHVGERNDVFLEKLHSGEIFGERGILLSDALAVLLLLLIASGYWIWLFPKARL